MSTKLQTKQKIIRYYREQTGITEINMREVAKFASQRGLVPLPIPKDPIDILAAQFSDAAREEIRHDKDTKRPYRANLAISNRQGSKQMTFWLDIDDPSTTRPKMLKNYVQRREQIVGDALQITYDLQHWSSTHPNEEPIQPQLDFGPDVQWRINGPQELAS